MYHQTQPKQNASAPFLCMRLMCSQNQDEVDLVKNELLKAGIPSETRSHPIAEALGVRGVELWVQDERNFFDAAKLYERMQDRAAGRPPAPATPPQADASQKFTNASEPDAQQCSIPRGGVNGVDSRQVGQPRRQELKQASSLLEKGLEEMFLRETELAGKCAALGSKTEVLSKALVQAQAELARERESRTAAEKNHLAERQARIAAEQRAERASLGQQSLEKQLLGHKQLVRQIQAHAVALNSLFLNKTTQGVAVAGNQ